MRARFSRSFRSTLLLAGIAATILGCATEEEMPAKRPDPVDPQVLSGSKQDFTAALKDSRAKSLKIKDQVSLTSAALQRLVDPSQADLRSAYDAYSKAVVALESEAKPVMSLAAKMHTEGQQYFSYWSRDLASYTNEDVREESETRRQEILETFTEAESELDGMQDSLGALLLTFKDVQKYLGNTLSKEGIEEMSSAAEEASENSTSLSGKIDSVVGKIDSVVRELAM